MTHCDRAGNSKVKKHCTLPLTAKNVVDVLITDRAVFHFTEQGMVLKKIMPGFSKEDITQSTEAHYTEDY